MKILFSGFIIDPKSGGEPQMAFSWILGALRNGHEVHVFTPPNSAKNLKTYVVDHSLENICL